MPSTLTHTGAPSPEPFRTHAAKYHELGLSVLPCTGADGKKAAVKWTGLQRNPVQLHTLYRWIETFPSANIAIVTGKVSGITVIDSDDPQLKIQALFDCFGETPLIVQTPRGGYHLYYRYSGEHSVTAIQPNIDIRGDRGFIIAPPSEHPITGNTYNFIEGGLEDILDLPPIQHLSDKIIPGNRNNYLFRLLLSTAALCTTIEELQRQAVRYNETKVTPPLDNTEITEIVGSVWRYKSTHRLYPPNEAFIRIAHTDIANILFKHPHALALYCDLLSCHKGHHVTFAISPKAYAIRCGWSPITVRRNIKVLIQHELIKRTRIGGKQQHDPSLYQFV